MSFLKSTNVLSSYKLRRTSGASTHIIRLKTFYNFQSKFPKLLLCKRNIAGRTSSGQISVFTKGSRGLKLRLPFTNYNFRDSSLFLLGGLRYAFSKKKINALLLTSSGCFTYIPLNLNYKFFTLLRLNSLFLDRVGGIGWKDLFKKPYASINRIDYLIFQQKKNSPISFVAKLPGHRSIYTRSIGSKSFIRKMDTRTGLGLIYLSSGLRKVFSIFALSSEGAAIGSIAKKKFKNTKFGFYFQLGKKPKVRGVAMNPVDHPHGGRTNSIKYPRTPWGKTTKFK